MMLFSCHDPGATTIHALSLAQADAACDAV